MWLNQCKMGARAAHNKAKARDTGHHELNQEDTQDKPGGPLASHRYGKEWAGLIILLAVLFSLGAYLLASESDKVAARERQRLETQARVIEENIVRQLQGVNAALTGVRYGLVSGDLGGEASALTLNLKVLAEAMPGVRTISVLDAPGTMTASNRRQLIGQNFSQREYFSVPKAGLDATILYASPPYRSVLGPWVLNVTRVMIGSDGKFAGVVTATLDPEYFEIVMRSVLYADDMTVRLAHGDGKLLLVAPANEKLLGANQNVPGSLFSRHLASGQAVNLYEDDANQSNDARMLAIRSVAPADLRMDKPLIVQVSRSLRAVYAPWHEDVRTFMGFSVLSAMVASVALYFSQRRRRALAAAGAIREEARRRSARRLEFVLKGADLGLWDWDIAADRLSVNEREWQMMGYAQDEITLTLAAWQGLIHPDDWPAVQAAFYAHTKGKTPAYKIEHRLRHKQGHWVWVLNHAMVAERDANGMPVRMLGTHLDISERKRVEAQIADNAALLEQANAQLSRLSLTDGLTGIGNRRLFDQTLAAEWTRGARQKQPLALLMMDIDHFKLYNDTHGHQGGDDCLRQVASLLAACVLRGGELLARYGGEEFAVLLPHSDATAAAVVAQRCLDRLNAARLPHSASPVSEWVTLSIGIASVTPRPGLTAESLVKSADAALYNAKRLGRARFESADTLATITYQTL